jgi:hypothetical protein
MRVDRSLAGVALFRLSPDVRPPRAIPGGKRDNEDDSEYGELARTSHEHSPPSSSLPQLVYWGAPAARYELRILSPFDWFKRNHRSL